MRVLSASALVLLIGIQANAQRGGHRGGGSPGVAGGHPGVIVGGVGTVPYRTYGSASGFGNVVFPGMGSAPPHTSFFANRLGASISGNYRYGGYGRVARAQYPAAYPVPVPVYVSDPYAYQPQLPPPNITVVLPSPEQVQQSSARPVTINQYFGDRAPEEGAQPQTIEYGPDGQVEGAVRTFRAPASQRSASTAPAEEQVMFYVPLKDSSVYTAVAYWVDGPTLHYITTQGQHNQVSVELVDRDLSDRLNRGRKIQFVLPPPK